MAFVRKNLTKIGGGNGGNALYHYTTEDAMTTTSGQVLSTGYFNDASDLLEPNDVIYCIDTNGTTSGLLLTSVKSVSAAGVVDVAAGFVGSNA